MTVYRRPAKLVYLLLLARTDILLVGLGLRLPLLGLGGLGGEGFDHRFILLRLAQRVYQR